MGTYAVTGGASGIGEAIKLSLRNDGHRVVVVDISAADIEADLSTTAGRQAAVDAIKEACPEGLDGFITSAGVASQAPTALTTSLNYYGTIELVNGVFDLLAANKGTVLLVSSNSAPMCTALDFITTLLEKTEADALAMSDAIDGHQAYSGTKQAVSRWMRYNVNRFSAAGIRINAIAPGYTQTPMTASVEADPEYGPKIRAFMDTIPLGRPGKPADMANAARFLMSDKASFISGVTLFVDGGHDAMFRPDNI